MFVIHKGGKRHLQYATFVNGFDNVIIDFTILTLQTSLASRLKMHCRKSVVNNLTMASFV